MTTTGSSLLRGFLLTGDCTLARTLPRTGVGVGPLAAHRESPAVAHAAVAVDFHQPLDVESDVLAEIAFHLPLVSDDLTDLANVILGQVLDADVPVDLGLAQD